MRQIVLGLILVALVFAAADLADAAQQSGPASIAGVWNTFGGGRTLSNQAPPMTPEGQRRFNANKPSYGERAIPPALGNDPVGNCDPLGLVRLIHFNRPFELIVLPDRIVQFFEWSHIWRDIWTDGRKLPEDPELRWYGYSVGRWEGDTLIVESNGFDDRTWLDQFGNPYSSEMRLEERYRRVGDTLELQMTLTDPKIYARPWVSDRKVSRPASKASLTFEGWYGLREELCVPSVENTFNERIRNPAGGVPNR
jgi:hypothetical protein